MQTLPSSQPKAPAPWQTPSPQISPVVQTFPSSQGFVFGVWMQPVKGSQESVVQRFPSSQVSSSTCPSQSSSIPLQTSSTGSHWVSGCRS